MPEFQVCLFCSGNAAEPDHGSRCDGRQGRLEAAEPAEGAVGYAPYAHARTSDPDTSLAAALAVEASEVQQRVYALHRQHPEGLTDEELLHWYASAHLVPGRSLESKSSPRKRRSDLTNAGLLVDSGARRPLSSGRRGVVWVLAATGKG